MNPGRHDSLPWGRWALVVLTLTGVMFAVGAASLWLSIRADVLLTSKVLWPGTAIGLVAVMRYGFAVLPAVALANLLLIFQGQLQWPELVAMAAGDSLSIAVAVLLLRKFDIQRTPLGRVTDFVIFILIGAIVQSVVNVVVFFGLDAGFRGLGFPWGRFIDNLGLDGTMGTIVFAPLLLIPWTTARKSEQPGSRPEFAVLLTYTTCFCYIAFFLTLENVIWDRVISFFIFPAVLWASVRFGNRGVGVVLILSYALGIWGTLNRTGTFATNPVATGITALHVFMGLSAVAGFLISTALDERWRAQTALRENERTYRFLVETSADLIWSVDSQGRWTFVNQAVLRTHGYTPEEMIGRPFTDFYYSEEQMRKDLETFQKVKAGEPHFQYETTHRRKNGEPVYLSFNAVLLTDRFGNVVGTTGTATDVTERVKSQEKLRASESRFRSIFEFSPLGICIGREGRPLYVNPAFARMFGYANAEEILSLPVARLVPPEVRARIERQLRSQDPPSSHDKSYEITGLRKDGTRFPLSVAVERIPLLEGSAVVGFVTDLTDRQDLAERLRQSQKMEAVGRLAGGVAHDFNNLLTVILGYCDLLKESTPPNILAHKGLAEITRAGERAASLTQQLLAFSRRQVLNMEPMDLNARLLSTGDLLRRIIGEDIELETDLRAAPAVIRADPTQIDQVLLNLAVNARDAMPEGGTLTLSTRYVKIHEGNARLHIGARPGDYLLLSVRDTGKGMDENTKAHIFEPFFTTKERGKGTGLGLAMVYGIVQQTGGHISVDAEPGRGTCFEIYFPRHDGVARVSEDSEVKTAAARRQGPKATILLVEDEELVRGLVKRALEGHGYVVLEAASGEAAIALCNRDHESIDMVLTDVVMPQMSGPELAGRLVSMIPKVRILYMSGYTEGPGAEERSASLDAPLLAKPFTPRQLLDKVRGVLDGPKR